MNILPKNTEQPDLESGINERTVNERTVNEKTIQHTRQIHIINAVNVLPIDIRKETIRVNSTNIPISDLYTRNRVIASEYTRQQECIREENNTQHRKYMTVFIIAIILGFLIMALDLYFAYNDKTCSIEYVKYLSINLHKYLIVSGYIMFIVIMWCLWVAPILSAIGCCNHFIEETKNGIPVLAYVFGFGWHIIGALIFWVYIDNESCSRFLYNYMSVSLILKLITYTPSVASLCKCLYEVWSYPFNRYLDDL